MRRLGLSQHRTLFSNQVTSPNMPVSVTELEETLRNALPVAHLEIHDQSSGCGENYAILVVSEVSLVIIVLSPSNE